MAYSSILFLVTLFLAFELALPTPKGFNGWFGEGNGKDKDKHSKGFFDFWKLNPDENKRDQGRKKIRFALLNRKNHSWAEIKNGHVPKKVWKKNESLKILLHSYSKETIKPSHDIIERQNIIRIGQAYGNASKHSNVVVVDWTALAVEPEVQYNFVVGNIPIVGEVVADFITRLVRTKRLARLGDVHMVGYGMGAHVAAVAAKRIQNHEKHGGKVGRITGLDPAGVGFDDETGQKAKNKSVSLWKTDAEFVDVIHCNLGASKTIHDAELNGRYGSGVQAGHADFYPNGGKEQPGCREEANATDKYCHTKSCAEYFAKSIEGVEYMACLCQDYDELLNDKCNCTLQNGGVLMGEPCRKDAKGRYFLTVNGTENPEKNGNDLTTVAAPEDENEGNSDEADSSIERNPDIHEGERKPVNNFIEQGNTLISESEEAGSSEAK